MPSRLLAAEGFDIDILYSNSNIAPRAEYDRRLATLREFAAGEGVRVLEGTYDPTAWEAGAGAIGNALACDLDARIDGAADVAELLDDANRSKRCRACYRMRLEDAAARAVEGGYDVLSTTLAVSPYQFSDIIAEELKRAAGRAGIRAHFEDFRPYYDEATRISRELGMYRQDYCGCRFSIKEGEVTRAWVRKQQAARREEKRAAREAELARTATERAAKKREKAEYAAKQAKKRAVLKQMRAEAAAAAANPNEAASAPDPASAANAASATDND